MKESFAEFENELRRLTPIQPRAPLTARIAETLDAPPAKTRLSPVFWLPFAAAALAGVLALWHNFVPGDFPVDRPPAMGSQENQAVEDSWDQFRPVDYAEYLYGAREEEIVYLDDSSPMIPVRLFYLDTTVWENETRQIAFEMTVSREELVLLPLEIF